MGKLLNILTIVAVVYFAYWAFKRHINNKKLAQQGYAIKADKIRPITLFSIVMVSMYFIYMVYYLLSS